MRCVARTLAILILCLASHVTMAIDTGRRCCVYMIERPEKDWDYNFITMGVALLKTREEIVAFDKDGYVSKFSYAGDQCYEWDRYTRFRATAEPPVGQVGEVRWHGATTKTIAGDDRYAYALEMRDDGIKRVHLFDVSIEKVLRSVELTDGPLAEFSGNGGMTWTPDNTADGKFLFSLADGDIAEYDIDLTSGGTPSTAYLGRFSLPDTSSSDTGLYGIFVNKHETTGAYELWAYFRGSDAWYQYSYDPTSSNALQKLKEGSMLTERAHPTKPGALALVHVPNTDVLRVFVGNMAKWVYEMHLRRGKGRFKECPWHEKNLQTCCESRYSSTCREMTRTDCSKRSHPGTYMGPWKHWDSQKVLCGGLANGSTNANPCGVDDITNPSLVPATVPSLPNETFSVPSGAFGYVSKFYQNPNIDPTQWASDLEQLYLQTATETATTPSIQKGEGTGSWFSSHDTSGSFAATFAGTWHVKTGGKYTMQITCNDACRVYVDNSLFLSRHLMNDMGNQNAAKNLDAGNHVIFVTFWAQNSPWGFRMKIKGPDTNENWFTSTDFGNSAGIYTSGAPASAFELRPYETTHVRTSFERDTFDDLFFNRVDDDFNWVRVGGMTGSLWTGPNRAFDGRKYVYAEASGRRPGHYARLQSVNFTLGSGAFFSIQHSMYGFEVGTLQIDVLYDGTYKTIFSKHGNQGAGWDPIILNLGDINTPGRVISFLFTYVATGGSRGDVALDHFQGYLGTGGNSGHGFPPAEGAHPTLPSNLTVPSYTEATELAEETCATSFSQVSSTNSSIVDSTDVDDDDLDECFLTSTDLATFDLDDRTTDIADDIDTSLVFEVTVETGNDTLVVDPVSNLVVAGAATRTAAVLAALIAAVSSMVFV